MKKRIISFLTGGTIAAGIEISKAEKGSIEEAYAKGALNALNKVIEYVNNEF